MHANAIATSIDKGEGAGEACLAVTFTGTARDYFRIWLVNLCLSLATLGVFSAWAKVRKQRYFHSHTLLDGVPFQYLGRPFAILQGRVVAATFLLAYSLLSYIAPEVAPFMLAAAVVAAPWVILRSAAFAAHFRAHRNVRFQFKSDYLVAVATLYWLGAIPVLVTGSLFEWWGQDLLMLAVSGVSAMLFPLWWWRLKRFLLANLSYGGVAVSFEVRAWPFYRVYLQGMAMMLPCAAASVGVGFFLQDAHEALAMVSLLPMGLGYVLMTAHVEAQSGNLLWNHCRLGPVRVQATLRTWKLAQLYVTNSAAILVSCGLLLPWAVIRMKRYRASCLTVTVDGDLARLRGTEHTRVAAAGAEISEAFQLDMAL